MFVLFVCVVLLLLVLGLCVVELCGGCCVFGGLCVGVVLLWFVIVM